MFRPYVRIDGETMKSESRVKAIHLSRKVSGGVCIPFAAICQVNGKPFSGIVTVSWKDIKTVPEYDTLQEMVGTHTTVQTTCEHLTIDIRDALRLHFPKGVAVTVEVTNESHLPAWCVAE